MTRWQRFLTAVLLTMLLVGFVLAQSGDGGGTGEEERDISFVIESEIGRALPRALLYDPNFERYMVVDAYGRLLLRDATTFDDDIVLYDRGNYNDYAFSHDGQYLALAVSNRIELYNANTGTLIKRLTQLGEPQRILGPMTFSRDDRYLIFEGVYPAPRSIRTFEGQTITVPWIWHIPTALETERSNFPGRAEAWQFFDYRNGMVISPDNRLVAALPGRLQVRDIETLDLLFEIPTDRYENDPMTVWFSARDNQVYIRPVTESLLIQVDTSEGVLVEIPLYTRLETNELEALGSIELSAQARRIGDTSNNDLKELFMGEQRFRSDRYGSGQHTLTLVDLVVPPVSTGDNILALIFIYNETEDAGYFELDTGGTQQLVLSPDDNLLLARQNDTRGEERIWKYDLDSGELLDNFIPSLRGIGRYRRAQKNRVLAYGDNGNVIVSDFQRYRADTFDVIREDLRYSRSFDRFFFTADSAHIVTMSGSEWRLWDAYSGEVERREVVQFNGRLVATSSDGFRFLTLDDDFTEVIDLTGGDVERRRVNFDRVPGSSIQEVYYSPNWERHLVIYSINEWGQYAPGNQIAMYEIGRGRLWHIAGDDLPPPEGRNYSWVDNDTVYVEGEGDITAQPSRIFGVDYNANGLPQCIIEQFPEQIDTWLLLWERLVYYRRNDELHRLSQSLCTDRPDTAAAVEQRLIPTSTPRPMTATPIVIAGVPSCLTSRYPAQAEEYARVWRELATTMNAVQLRDTEALLCEGIGRFDQPRLRDAGTYLDQTMMIDATSGERATGSFTAIERERPKPIGPIYDEFERTEDRYLGTAILSPDEQLVAASNLPGELVIYRLVRTYQDIMADVRATSVAIQQRQNLIYAQPSLTPTYNPIGTARPTLTPTMTPTPIPFTDNRADWPSTVDYCPSETLYTLDNLPEGYDPPGFIVAPLQNNVLWTVDPVTGRRVPDETIPQCTEGVNCTFSPDRQWILASAQRQLYVIRPDGSDNRLLRGEDDPKPNMRWFGTNTLEYDVRIQINNRWYDALQWDILGVFPDPDPWIPFASINELPTSIVSRQPGGDWLVARTQFSTGIGPGYKYYLYNITTGDYDYFARVDDGNDNFNVSWHPFGHTLFYNFDEGPAFNPDYYQLDMTTMTHIDTPSLPDGIWSNDGRYRVDETRNRTQQLQVWDSVTGLMRTYCVPETGLRYYEGDIMWSPDSAYLALRTFLPKDEEVEGVGRHLLILHLETGAVVDVTTGLGPLVNWNKETGTYGNN